MMSTIENDLIRQALRAAREVAGRLGAGHVDPVLLHHSQHISILLPSMATVARILVRTEDRIVERLSRELAVARHLCEREAPIVAPSTLYPAGPHFQGEVALTLWQFVEHVAADRDNREHMASAAEALRRVHDALARYPGELAFFRIKIEKCRTLLENGSELPALITEDRIFLLMVYDRVMASLDALPLKLVPIHGDAVVDNVFITSGGARWNDFEDTSLGPREWDVGWLPDIDLTAFEPVDCDLLSVLSDVRSLCVSVWCWARCDMADKRQAAEYHLRYLKERFA